MQEPVVFERRPGRATLTAVAAVFAAGCTTPLLADRLGDLAKAHAPTFTHAAAVGELVGVLLYLAPVLIAVLLLAWGSRRFARAIVARDHVVIEPFGIMTSGATVVALPDVVGRKDTPHGVLLDAPASFDRFTAFFFPPLIPARDPEELARIHALLDAPAVETPADVPTAVGGKSLAPHDLLGVAVVLGHVAAGVFILDDLGGRPSFAGGWLLFTAAALFAITLVPRRCRVHLGATWVSVGPTHVPWSAVREVACDERAFYLEVVDGRRRVGRPGGDELGPLLAVARARLPGGSVVTGTPPWARRRRKVMRVAIALSALAGLWLGPVRAFTLEGCVGVDGHHGQRARIVHRGFDGVPLLIVIVEPPHAPLRVRAGGWRSPAFEETGTDVGHPVDVDLRAGRVLALGEEHAVPPDATVVHVRRDGVRWSRAPLSPHCMGTAAPPSSDVMTMNVTLHEFLAWPARDVPVVRDVIEGRSAVRCFDALPQRLLMQAREGALTSMVLLDPGANLARWSLVGGCWPCLFAEERPGRLLRLTAAGDVLEADLPGFEVALTAYQDVCDGRPVEQATASFAGELWSRPVTGGR